MAVHRSGFYFVIVMTFLVFLGTVALNIIAMINRFDITNDILPVDPIAVFGELPVSFDISSWFHYVQLPIALWHFFWLAYGLGTLCRHDLNTGGYLYYSPPYMPITMYAMFGMAMISQVAWLFAWSYHYPIFALAFLAMVSFTLYMALYFSATALYRHAPDLARGGQTREIAMVRGLVLNGIALHSGYVDFLVTLILGKVLVHKAGVEDDTSGLIVFSVYLIAIVCFMILEISVWDKYARYIFMHYIVAVVGLLAVLFRNLGDGSEWSRVQYVVIACLLAACIAVLGKLIAACVRDRGDKRLAFKGTSVQVKQ